MLLQQDQEFVAQPSPFQPGERTVKMWLDEPEAGINEGTGLMLCLHNWGGIYDQEIYVGWCQTFAERYNTVTCSVNYLQSGDEWQEFPDRPYDHGYLQAMDCLGALYHIRRQLAEAGVTWNDHRYYSMGGSGGGNVTQMVMKLAPHTFAAGVDICGMPGLIEEIAYRDREEGSPPPTAGYSRDPNDPRYLTRDMIEIRDFGHPEHCRLVAEANPGLKIVIVHGLDDQSCAVVPKIRQFANMIEAGIEVDGHFLTPWDVDGEAVTTTGHPVGNRDKVVMKYADEYMLPDGRLAKSSEGPSDFERGGVVEFPTTNGRYTIDFSGYPAIDFV